jgi:hypothetical protein
MKHGAKAFTLILAASVFLTSCFGTSSTNDSSNNAALLLASTMPSTEAFALNGSWKDDYNTTHTINVSRTFSISSGTISTTGTWNDGYDNSIIVEFDNTGRYAYGQRPSTASYNASKFFKRVYTTYNNQTYYCEIIYGKATLADAKAATDTSSTTNPASTGCGGFAWSKLTKQ